MKVEVRRSEYAHPTGLLFAGYPPVRFPAEAAGEQRGNAAPGLGALTQYAATWRASSTSRRSERRRLRTITRQGERMVAGSASTRRRFRLLPLRPGDRNGETLIYDQP